MIVQRSRLQNVWAGPVVAGLVLAVAVACGPESSDSSLRWVEVRAQALAFERVAETCSDAAVDPREVTCLDHRSEDGNSVCSKGTDCGGGVCMRLDFGGPGACWCAPAQCVTDADCPASKACFCGTFSFNLEPESSATLCRQSFDVCGSGCVTSSCRSSADCPEGGLCVVDKGPCINTLQRPDVVWGAHCLTPDNYDCVPNSIRETDNEWQPDRCTWDAELQRWRFHGPATC